VKANLGARMSNESFLSLFMLGVLVVLFGVACLFVPNFYRPRNMVNILTNNWFIVILGIGVTFLLITGNFDMSVGGNIAMTGVLSVWFCQAAGVSQNVLANGLGLPYAAALVLALVCAMGIGAINAFFIARLKVPSIIITLGTMMLARGVAQIVTRGAQRNTSLPADDRDLRLEDNLEEFTEVIQAELDFLAGQLAANRASGRALFGVVPGAGLGDIACVPGPWMKHPKGIRDITEWYISTASRREFLHRLFDRQTDIVLHNLSRIHRVVGEAMDLAWVCGTDFGTQSSTFCSPQTYTELYQPYYLKVNNWIHRNTGWKTFKHCCGSVTTLMEGFIASGFDVLNPVQWTAANMDPKGLKQRFGDRIVFWGGGVDTQRTLPFGTPAQVRQEVLRACEIFAPGGGFVFNTIHNIQARTPIQNVVAMLEAVKEFNGGQR